MEINRRTFFFLGFSFAIAKTLGMYVPSEEIYKPSKAQIDFMKSYEPRILYGGNVGGGKTIRMLELNNAIRNSIRFGFQ